MRKRIWLLAGMPLVLAACAADEPEIEVVEVGTMEAPVAATPTMGEMGAMASTVPLAPLGDAQVNGEAILTPAGDQTQVSVTLSGLEANGTHPGHIHQGTCDSVGSVVIPLSEITADASGSGTMTTTVAIAANTVMAGNHIVVYHATGGTPIVCGEVEGHVM